MFSNQHRQEVKDANPQLTMVEIAKKLGEMWRGMEQDVRKEWEDKATSAKDNYLVSPTCLGRYLGSEAGLTYVALAAQEEKKMWLEQRQAVQASPYEP
jgi:hypothetical protein